MRLLWNERYTVLPPILLYLGRLGWFKTLGARASTLRYYLMPCFGCAEAKICSCLVSQQDHSISIRQTTDWVWRWNPRGRGRGARAGGRRFEHRSLPPEDVQESLATKAIRACRGMDQTYLFSWDTLQWIEFWVVIRVGSGPVIICSLKVQRQGTLKNYMFPYFHGCSCFFWFKNM